MTTSRAGSTSAVATHGNPTTYLSKKDVRLSTTNHDSDLHGKVPALVGKIAKHLPNLFLEFNSYLLHFYSSPKKHHQQQQRHDFYHFDKTRIKGEDACG